MSTAANEFLVGVKCLQCGTPIVGRSPLAKYCSRDCQVAANRRTNRVLSERPMGNAARKLLGQLQRDARQAAQATAGAEAAAAELATIREGLEARFGRPIPANALLLDVLDQVEIEDGDVWRWRGGRNNKGLATIRVERGEKSTVRFLAVQFGLLKEEDFGFLYPRDGDTDDVNPWHRELRHADAPMGNRDRFTIPFDEAAVS